MKPFKLAISVITLACCSAAALPAFADQPFTGLNIGVGLENNMTQYDQSWSAVKNAMGTVRLNGSQNSLSSNLTGNIFMFYGIPLGSSYLIAPELGFVTQTRTSDIYGNAVADVDGDKYNYSSQVQMNSQFEGSFILGRYLTQNNNLAYVKLGGAYAQLTASQAVMTSGTYTSTEYPSVNKQLFGTLFGLGFMRQLDDGKVAVGVESDYIHYQSTQISDAASNGSSTTTYQPSQLRISMNLIFKF